MKALIDKLKTEQNLSREEWIRLISAYKEPGLSGYLFQNAREVRQKYYGHDVYIRGLIEFTNFCKNDCYYCGIRRSSRGVRRYRLSKEEILSCCAAGYELGFRTFVLQGGEDGYFTDERMAGIIRAVKQQHPDCALTLSIGERSFESYRLLFEAGADRYLLRHETYDKEHYALLHPPDLSAENRQKCLWDLKKAGYQVGAGFMVGSPGQTPEHLADDMLFLKRLDPQMAGIGPFIPHHDTRFRNHPPGSLELTLFLLGLIRLMIPKILLPSTTALGTIHPEGRELGILAGANVIMPNLSPENVRKDYALYDNKLCTGEEAAEGLQDLKRRMEQIGCRIAVGRGDSLNRENPA